MARATALEHQVTKLMECRHLNVGNYAREPAFASGGAGLVSTLDDYRHFASMLLHGGEYGGRRYLSPRALRLMRTPEYPHLTGTTNRWGLGVRVIDNEEKILPVGCFGWSGAYGTHFWVDPANRVTAVYMKNSHYDCGGGALTGKHFEADVTAGFTD